MLSSIHQNCAAAEGQVVGVTSIDESGPLLSKPGQIRRSSRSPFKNLLHIHRGFRHERHESSESAALRNVLIWRRFPAKRLFLFKFAVLPYWILCTHNFTG